MIDITPSLIKELRDRTGLGLAECKRILIEAQGDIEIAIDNSRKLKKIRSINRSDRPTLHGMILTETKKSYDHEYGIIMEINCETDFVAQSNEFKFFSREVILKAVENRISDINILKSKFEEKLIELSSKTNENISIRRIRFLQGDTIVSYLHGIRIGVLVAATGEDKNLLKQIAMHVAASRPEYISTLEIPSYIIDHEYQIQVEIAKRFGKDQNITKKIVEESMKKYKKNVSLIDQDFVLNPIKTVGQVLKERNIKINFFIRFELGEKI